VSAAASAWAPPRFVTLLERSYGFLCRSVAAHLLPDGGAETFGTYNPNRPVPHASCLGDPLVTAHAPCCSF
jgi:hypothetical protein